MAVTNTNSALILKSVTLFNRAFFFGTASLTLSVSLAKIPLTGLVSGITFSAAAGTVSEIGGAGNGNGWYNVALTAADTNTPGMLLYHVTGTGGPLEFSDFVQPTIFTDLALTGSGNTLISAPVKQNQPLNAFPFVMRNVANGQPQPGLTVTAQRSLGNAGFAPCSFAPAEIGGAGNGMGGYTHNLSASDLNSSTVMLLYTSPGATALFIPLLTVP